MLFKKDSKDLIVHMNKSGYVFVLDKNTGNIARTSGRSAT
jgi:alcohol dehydrogenase (cytochrome c)